MTFSDAQRAQVYVRDRAICSFTGKSLWILDYGATPFWDIDWVDHMRPLSRGGRSVLDNAACTASERNWAKRNNGADNRYLFRAGRPTEDCIYELGEIPADVARRLRRFAVLEPSDWYFNRALSHVLIYLQVEWEHGCPVRDRRYWCAAAAKKLAAWRKMTARPDYRSFERRGLVSRNPSPDVAQMLELRSIAGRPDAVDRLIRAAQRLYPCYRVNASAVWQFAKAKTNRDRAKVMEAIKTKKKITDLARHALVSSYQRLQSVP